MKKRSLSLIAGISYLIIFFAAIFANFLVLDSLKTDPLATVEQNSLMVRLGTMAFMVTVVFDVVVAWALNQLYKKHILSSLSTYFRMMHAAIMGVAVFALPVAVTATTAEEILKYVDIFNIIWLIGLFFFGIHLILLGKILQKPRFISILMIVAGIMYMVDTSAHFLMANYNDYASIFLAMVAAPSIVGEMSFTILLLMNKNKT